MKILKLCILALVISACSSLKQSQKALNSGNYDESIRISVEKLRKNKVKKSHQPYIPLLHEAFTKAVARDEQRIAFLKQEGHRANIEEIFNLYRTLAGRQERIKPLLPLGNATFSMKDYSAEIIATKEKFAAYLYEEAAPIFNTRTKMGYRKAFQYYKEIDDLISGYRDVKERMGEAHYKGRDFVLVKVYNETEQIIPKRLEEDLLNFSSYGLNDFWTVYDSTKQEDVTYDFGLELVFKKIKISPERMSEREIIQEKQVIDGKEYVRDKDGNVLVDSVGNKLTQDHYITVKGRLYEFSQQKDCQMVAIVNYTDLARRTVIESFPLTSAFAYRHRYGNISGDKRVFSTELLRILRNRREDFPSNEQMVFDAGMDLKNKFKHIIVTNHFR